MRLRLFSSLVVITACTSGSRTEVATNDLGVVKLESERYVYDGTDVFALHAYGDDGDERASIRLIRGLDDSAFTVSIDGHESTARTRETSVVLIDPNGFADPKARALLHLPAVSATLERDGAVSFPQPQAAPETPYYAINCPSGALLSSPVVHECCYDGTSTTAHKDNEDVVQRLNWGYGTCKAYNGGSCSGKDCYWGPFGFSAPTTYAAHGSYAYIYDNYGANCAFTFSSTNQSTPFYQTMAGSNPTACSCACDYSGRACYDSSKAGTCPNAPTCEATGCTPLSTAGAHKWDNL